MKNIQNIKISRTSKINEALKKIAGGGIKIALVVCFRIKFYE